jgi:hypothetical protein
MGIDPVREALRNAPTGDPVALGQRFRLVTSIQRW